MRRGSLAGGLILVLIGVVFLLSNFGVLEISPWELVGAYWPLLLILAGVAILFGATARWVIFVIVVVVAGVAALGIPFGWSGPGGRTTTTILPDTSVSGAAALELDVVIDAGRIRTGSTSSELYRLSLTHPSGLSPVQTTTRQGETARLHVESRGRPLLWGSDAPQQLTMGFSRDVRLALDLRVSAGETDLDLSPYDLTRLSVRNSVGKVTLRLGEVKTAVPVDIHVSTGDVVAYVPEEVGLRVTGDTGVGTTEFQHTGLHRVGSGWEDDAYSSAAGRVELSFAVSVGKLTVRRY